MNIPVVIYQKITYIIHIDLIYKGNTLAFAVSSEMLHSVSCLTEDRSTLLTVSLMRKYMRKRFS